MTKKTNHDHYKAERDKRDALKWSWFVFFVISISYALIPLGDTPH